MPQFGNPIPVRYRHNGRQGTRSQTDRQTDRQTDTWMDEVVNNGGQVTAEEGENSEQMKRYVSKIYLHLNQVQQTDNLEERKLSYYVVEFTGNE